LHTRRAGGPLRPRARARRRHAGRLQILIEAQGAPHDAGARASAATIELLRDVGYADRVAEPGYRKDLGALARGSVAGDSRHVRPVRPGKREPSPQTRRPSRRSARARAPRPGPALLPAQAARGAPRTASRRPCWPPCCLRRAARRRRRPRLAVLDRRPQGDRRAARRSRAPGGVELDPPAPEPRRQRSTRGTRVRRLPAKQRRAVALLRASSPAGRHRDGTSEAAAAGVFGLGTSAPGLGP
jgi:hypothetical protein